MANFPPKVACILSRSLLDTDLVEMCNLAKCSDNLSKPYQKMLFEDAANCFTTIDKINWQLIV